MFKNYFLPANIWLLFMICPVFLFGQHRIDNTKPHVYLAFEKNDGENITLSFHNNSKWAVKVCARAYTPYPLLDKSIINDKEVFTLKNEGEYKLCYGTETYFSSRIVPSKTSVKEQRKRDKLEKKKSDCDAKQTYLYIDDNQNIKQWIASGESVKFSVPAKYLQPAQGIYVTYQYDWEESEYSDEYRQPEHRTEFFDFQL